MYLYCPLGIEAQKADLVYGYKLKDDIVVVGRCHEDDFDGLHGQFDDLVILARCSGPLPLSSLQDGHLIIRYDPEILALKTIPDALFNAAIICQAHHTKITEPETGLASALASVQGIFTQKLAKISPCLLPDRSDSLFDLLLGMILGAAVVREAIPLSQSIIILHRVWNLRQLPLSIEWLMGWPAGLKLNSSLSKFIGELYLWLLSLWNDVITDNLLAYLPSVLTFIGLSGCALGLSVMIQTASIVARVVTLHWEAFFLLALRLFTAERTILRSLWRLMRGKKWNVLHERLDSADYSLDQLLLGTVMFATTLFLFPTILVYFLLFLLLAAARSIIQTSINSFALLLVIPAALNSDRKDRRLVMEPYRIDQSQWVMRPSSRQFMQCLQPIISTAGSIIARHFANPL